jgi:hypothetical protein
MAYQIEQGKLEYRITQISERAELVPIAWQLNSALGQVETYMREVAECFNAAKKQQFYRQLNPVGMPGRILVTVGKACSDTVRKVTKSRGSFPHDDAVRGSKHKPQIFLTPYKNQMVMESWMPFLLKLSKHKRMI